MAHVFGVLVGVYQADTGRLAALDLVLQARSSAISVVAVFALAYQKGLLQQAEAFTNGPGTRIGAEITPFGALGATVQDRLNHTVHDQALRERASRSVIDAVCPGSAAFALAAMCVLVLCVQRCAVLYETRRLMREHGTPVNAPNAPRPKVE